MQLRNRFILIGFWMIFFILATPVMVLYALGYKFDLSTKQVIKTGSLVAISEPVRSHVYIDDQMQKTRTGKTLRFILPGDYVFKISKDGYQSWTKRMNIKSGLVTWANQDRDFVTLFYNQPKTQETENYSGSIISVKENSAIVVAGNKISKYDPNNQNLRGLSETLPTFNPPLVLPNNESNYFYWQDQLYTKFTAEQIQSAQDIQSNGRYALLLVNQQLVVGANGGITTLAVGVSGFHLDQDHVWYVQNNILKHTSLNTGVTEDLGTLSYSPVSTKIIRGNSQIFLILDGTAYALNDKVEEIYRGVTYAYWDNEYERLILANSNEALMFDPSSFRSELVIRSSTAIGQPIVNRHTGYMFFINEGKIKAIELDGRDHRNVYTILDQPAKGFLLNEPGDILTSFTETEYSVHEIR